MARLCSQFNPLPLAWLLAGDVSSPQRSIHSSSSSDKASILLDTSGPYTIITSLPRYLITRPLPSIIRDGFVFQSLASSQHRKFRSCRWRLAAFRLLWTFQFPQLPQAMLPLLVRRTKWIRYDCDSSRNSPSRRPWCDHANTQHAIAGMVRRSPSALQQVSLACGTLSRAQWTATLLADSPRAEFWG